MRIYRSRAARVLMAIVVSVVLFLCACSSTPSPAWSTSFPGAINFQYNTLVGTSDGVVVLPRQGPTVVAKFDATGAESWQVAANTDEQSTGYQRNLATDPSGLVVWQESDGTNTVSEVAVRGGTRLWTQKLTRNDDSVAIGNDGNVYSVENEQATQSPVDLVARNRDTGAVIRRVQLPASYTNAFDYPVWLGAFGGGIVVYSDVTEQIVWVSYSGTITTVNAPASGFAPNAPDGAQGWAVGDHSLAADGSLYLYASECLAPGNSGSCGQTTPLGRSVIARVSPSGSTWIRSIDWAQGVIPDAPLPSVLADGGVTMPISDDGTSGMTAYNTDGTVRWTDHFTGDPDMPSTADDVSDFGGVPDEADHIILTTDFRGPDPRNPASDSDVYWDTAVSVLNGTTGARVDGVVFRPQSGPGDLTSEGDTVSPGKIYVAVASDQGGQGLWAYSSSIVGAVFDPRFNGAAALTSVTLAGPSPSDPYLSRALNLLGGGGSTVNYQWVSPSGVASAVQSVPLGSPTWISFADTQPNQTWTLRVQTADASGGVSPWVSTTTLTPPVPVLVALGDSITSGHHKDSATAVTICNDASYSYAATVVSRMQTIAGSATQWAPQYTNYAVSGYGEAAVISGGQLDACGMTPTFSGSPLSDAATLLKAHAGSWNHVVITAGIDDTNWVATLGIVLENQTALGPSYLASSCNTDIQTNWSGYNTSVETAMTANTAKIASTLHTADPDLSLDWLSYYNIGGTGPLSSVCNNAVATADSQMTQTLTAGLTSSGVPYNWISSAALDNQAASIQSWYTTDTFELGSHAGWPHPNSTGASTLGDAVPLD